jgi:hypothetical protein
MVIAEKAAQLICGTLSAMREATATRRLPHATSSARA